MTHRDVPDLIPLLQGYCAFYGTSPPPDDLRAMASALIDDRAQGMQLISRDEQGRPLGFATLLWSWDTTVAGRVGVMQDLFVVESARGRGVAAALIAECARRVGAGGGRQLLWQTAVDNRRAQAVYDRTGAARTEWFEYVMPV